MSVSCQVSACFLSLLALTACESDEKKLERLNGDRAIACLNEEHYQKLYLGAVPGAYKDSVGREYMDFHTKCELVTRDLNRFMRE